MNRNRERRFTDSCELRTIVPESGGRASRYFEVLGVDPELLKDSSYIEYQLGLDIEGREVSFGTKEEEYNGRRNVKVVWIGRRSDPNLSHSAARFFGGTTGDGEIPGEELAF